MVPTSEDQNERMRWHTGGVCAWKSSPGHGGRKEAPKYDPERVQVTPSSPGGSEPGRDRRPRLTAWVMGP